MLLVLLAAGCGGGSSSKPLTKAELIKRGDAICLKYRKKNVALQKRAPKTSPTSPFASDADVRQAGPILAQLADNLRGARGELSGLRPPKAIDERWKTAMDEYDRIATNLDRASVAAHAVDRQGVVNAYTRALEINTSLQKFETGYGFGVCGHAAG